MRLSGLALAFVLLLSSLTFAQHSSGGGGGSSGGGGGGSSSGGSSGGGSHGSSGGGGSYSGGSGGGHASGGSYNAGGGHASGGGHVYNGSSSRGSSSSNPTSHGAGSAMLSRSGERTSIVNEKQTNRSLSAGSQLRSAQPEKRTFFSIFKHPFHRPQSNHVASVPRPICTKGHCTFCGAGQVSMGGACIGGSVPLYQNNYCFQGRGWIGGSCLQSTTFMGNCSALRMFLAQQEQRIQAADAIRQSACMNSASQACVDAERNWQSEQSLYRAWMGRYQRCLAGSWLSYRYGGISQTGYGSGVLFDPLRIGVDY